MKSVWIPIGLLLIVANVLVVGRLWRGGEELSRLRPETHYQVSLRMETDLHGQPASIHTFLPVGVLIVIFFRSVIGFTTFGTFHPALLAVAFRESGLAWGIALYVIILGAGLIVRALLDRITLLHTPRLALSLLLVVAIILAVTLISVAFGNQAPANISMFPIAILAITIESSFTRWSEVGAKRAALIFLQTLM